MIRYVAFLRGINVGGHKTIKMAELRETFATLGFENVKTILASGNVIFEAPETNDSMLTKKLETQLQGAFGHEIGLLTRTVAGLQNLARQNPFAGIQVTPQTRLYVTFLSGETRSGLKIPYTSPDKNFKIIRATDSEVCSVVTLSPKGRTIDLMSILEKEFGRKVTTRNWNTVNRILKASQATA